MLFVMLLFLIIIGMVGGYNLALIDQMGSIAALLGGILVTLIYIALQIPYKNKK